jgi:2-methylisocitrate lyase-like PEP mutase family enzyme
MPKLRTPGAEAARGRAEVSIVINARADTFLPASGVPEAERVAEAVRRGGLYLGAGADCIYPIGVSDEKDIAALVAGAPGPINANTRPGAQTWPSSVNWAWRGSPMAPGSIARRWPA